MLGAHQVALDGKGRVAIPAKYRQRLQDAAAGRFVLTVSPNQRCLWLYPLPEWQVVDAGLKAIPAHDAWGQRLRYLLLAYAAECELDAAGRLLLPPPLREEVGLSRDVMLLGMQNKFEIWDEATFRRHAADLRATTVGEESMSPASRSLVL